jgi:hypothetical protein
MNTNIDYARLGRQYARRAIKELFSDASVIGSECEHDEQLCDECFFKKALDKFHEIQLRDAINPKTRYVYPTTQDAEKVYNDSASEFIMHAIKTKPRHNNSAEYITSAEDAYSLGLETMTDVASEVLRAVGTEAVTKAELTERCNHLFRTNLETGAITVPRVHGMLKDYYERGLQSALQKVEPPMAMQAVASTNKRAARYGKQLI